jgi:hypothetical protein
MRVWDISPNKLCTKHLIVEHRELHGLWNILTIYKAKGGYSRHPETLRWVGKLKALFLRHEDLVAEMLKRKYDHKSRLDKKYAKGGARQDKFINTTKEQKQILNIKNCDCRFE